MPLVKPGLWSAHRGGVDPRFDGLWNGLIGLLPLWDNLSDPVLRGSAINNGAAWFDGPTGPALSFVSADNDEVVWDPFASIITSTNKSLVVVVTPLAGGDAIHRSLSLYQTAAPATNFSIFYDSGGNWGFGYRNTSNTFVNADAGAAVVNGQPAVVVLRQRGSNISFWVNGVNVDTNTDAGAPGTVTPTASYLGRHLGSTSESATSRIHMAAVYSRALGDGEIRLLARDPFGMFRPAILTTEEEEGGGGAGGGRGPHLRMSGAGARMRAPMVFPGFVLTEGSASGAITWVGSATGARASQGAASGAISWAGSATGARASQGAASGAISWDGSATGEAPVEQMEGEANGAITWAGSATGARASQGSATGAISWAGSATGARESRGATSGAVTWAGSATGARTPKGDAAGAITWAGSAAGARASQGSATGAISWAGSAQGEAPPEGATGSAEGAITWAGSATGITTRSGASAGAISWVGSATGSAPKGGTISGAIGWAGSATGASALGGQAFGAITWAGLALGQHPFHGPWWIPDPVAHTSGRVEFEPAPVPREPL